MATFSFFGNKLLTCGEGGAVTVNDAQLDTRLRILRGQGMDPQRRYYFPVTGYNFRLTNVAAAILCAQLERKDEILACRRAIFERYRELLGPIRGIGFQPTAEWARISPWMFAATVDAEEFGCTRDELAAALAEQEVETRPLFHPLHKLPPFREESQQRGERLPVTDELAASAIMLPTYNLLTDADLVRITGAIADVRKARRKRPAPLSAAAA
jgi:perosamine synthetase